MRRRVPARLLAAVGATALVLTACGGDDTAGSSTTQPPAAGTTQEADPATSEAAETTDEVAGGDDEASGSTGPADGSDPAGGGQAVRPGEVPAEVCPLLPAEDLAPILGLGPLTSMDVMGSCLYTRTEAPSKSSPSITVVAGGEGMLEVNRMVWAEYAGDLTEIEVLGAPGFKYEGPYSNVEGFQGAVAYDGLLFEISYADAEVDVVEDLLERVITAYNG